jgi:hypothetical protein
VPLERQAIELIGAARASNQEPVRAAEKLTRKRDEGIGSWPDIAGLPVNDPVKSSWAIRFRHLDEAVSAVRHPTVDWLRASAPDGPRVVLADGPAIGKDQMASALSARPDR